MRDKFFWIFQVLTIRVYLLSTNLIIVLKSYTGFETPDPWQQGKL